MKRFVKKKSFVVPIVRVSNKEKSRVDLQSVREAHRPSSSVPPPVANNTNIAAARNTMNRNKSIDHQSTLN